MIKRAYSLVPAMTLFFCVPAFSTTIQFYTQLQNALLLAFYYDNHCVLPFLLPTNLLKTHLCFNYLAIHPNT